MNSYRLAPMSRDILILTLVLLALPILFLGSTLFARTWLTVPGLFLILIYAWVWLRFRPTVFVLHPRELEVVWPVKRRRLNRDEITEVRHIDKAELRRKVGFGMRVGAGGLWGGFGWLWTARRGIVQMYISRTDDFVWIEFGEERPWLITPEQPALFVRALSRQQ